MCFAAVRTDLSLSVVQTVQGYTASYAPQQEAGQKRPADTQQPGYGQGYGTLQADHLLSDGIQCGLQNSFHLSCSAVKALKPTSLFAHLWCV